MAWNNPITWLAGLGNHVTAAKMNEQVRDNMNVIGGSWTTYTPVWTAATTNPTIGNGSIVGRYQLAGKWLRISIRIVGGSTTNWGTAGYSLTLPPGITPVVSRWKLNGIARDESATSNYEICAVWSSTAGSFAVLTPATTAGNNLRSVNSASPFTFATTDELFLSGELEVQ